MTRSHTTHSPETLSPDEARAGRKVKHMPLILGVSTAAAVCIGVIFMIAFAT